MNAASVDDVRKLVLDGSIPIHVIYNGKDYFRHQKRFSYLTHIATSIMKNNSAPFRFLYENVPLDDRFPLGVLYDQIDPPELPFKLHLHRIDTENESERLNIADTVISLIKFAEYFENGNTNKFANLTIGNHKKLKAALQMDDIYNPVFNRYAETTQSKKQRVAIRFHLKDGRNQTVAMPLTSRVFGICQGILVDNKKLADILYLKSHDNWLHICFPNATMAKENGNKDKITINLRAVGSTPILKQTAVKMKGISTVSVVENFIKSQLGVEKVYLYFDGLFTVDSRERICNMLADGKGRDMVIYYSDKEAWR